MAKKQPKKPKAPAGPPATIEEPEAGKAGPLKARAEAIPAPVVSAEVIEKVLLGGDLAQLKPEDRINYYGKVCHSLGLNPMTRPFDYITLNGKTILYARKDATEQLRKIHKVSVFIESAEDKGGVFVVRARAVDGSGRSDSSLGAVNVSGKKGEDLANAMMKAETKAKRRVTLSICGLGMLDETEVDSIQGAVRFEDSTPKLAEAPAAPPAAPAPQPPAPKPEAPKPAAPPAPEAPKASAPAGKGPDDIPFGGGPDVPPPAPQPSGDDEGTLSLFADSMKNSKTVDAVKQAWDSFIKTRPSTELSGKAWKLRSNRLAEIRGGAA